MRSIREIYEAHKASPVATAKHLEYLMKMATMCDSIWEIGVKRGASSSAFLAALEGTKGKLVSVDLKITKQALELKKAAGPLWDLHEADSLKFTFPGTCPDLIFFDSLHTYEQLKAELDRFGHHSARYLAFHDTITFATMGADGESGTYLPQPADRSCFDASSHGIRLAIDEFMRRDPGWRIMEHRPFGHGLLVLARRG
jgi:hypothetical protein